MWSISNAWLVDMMWKQSEHKLSLVTRSLRQDSQNWHSHYVCCSSQTAPGCGVQHKKKLLHKWKEPSYWFAKNFQCHLLGKRFYIKTDHKPIVPLLSSKCLDSLAPRVLRFKLCLARLDYLIEHVPRKNLCTADTLSRAPMATKADSTQDTMGWRDVDNKPELQCGCTEYPTRYTYTSVLIVWKRALLEKSP